MSFDLSRGSDDPLEHLTPAQRRRWAEDVLRSRAAIVEGLAVSGARFVRRAEAILGSPRG